MKINKFSLASAALALCISVPVAYAHGGGSDGDRDRGRDNDRSECPCQISFNKVSKAVRGDNKVLHDEFFSACVTEERHYTPGKVFSGNTAAVWLDSDNIANAGMDETGLGLGQLTSSAPNDAGVVSLVANYSSPLATEPDRSCSYSIYVNGGSTTVFEQSRPLTSREQYRACARDITEIASDLGLKCPK